MSAIKKQMIDDEVNPYQNVYFVDVSVSRIGDKVVAYFRIVSKSWSTVATGIVSSSSWRMTVDLKPLLRLGCPLCGLRSHPLNLSG
jgi:hypothetical protein